ncbi:hypothetical protein NW754_007128 [Fusarium falciforme]|nr:hypothetical protein NW754_007128 [Fusarium falciforme]
MRTVIPLLQLLALGHQAAASVCRPRVTSSSVSVESVTTSASTAASSTVSSTGSESTTWSSTETASSSTETASLSTTETASSSTESASLSTTESVTVSTTETASLSTTDSYTVISTTSSASESISTDSSTITSSTLFTSTTSTAEASSTTSSVPEVCPHNLVIPLTPRGQYDYNTGVTQPVPVSKVMADTQYEFSAWVKLSPSMRCQDFYIACSIGDGFMPGSFKSTAVPGVGGWLQLQTTCQWTQNWLNAGPGVAVIGQCTEADYYVDDASFKLVV